MTPQLFGLQWLSTTYIVLYLFTFVYQDSEITVDNYILLLLVINLVIQGRIFAGIQHFQFSKYLPLSTYIVLYLFTFVYQDSEITVDNYILLLLVSCFISLLISFVNSFLGVPPS